MCVFYSSSFFQINQVISLSLSLSLSLSIYIYIYIYYFLVFLLFCFLAVGLDRLCLLMLTKILLLSDFLFHTLFIYLLHCIVFYFSVIFKISTVYYCCFLDLDILFGKYFSNFFYASRVF